MPHLPHQMQIQPTPRPIHYLLFAMVFLAEPLEDACQVLLPLKQKKKKAFHHQSYITFNLKILKNARGLFHHQLAR